MATANILRSGAEYLRSFFRDRESLTVTYSRGATSFSVLATIGKTQAGPDQRTGLRLNLIMPRDFVISRADLVAGFADAEFEPLPEDEIVETDGTLEHTYEVTQPVGKTNVWDWHSLYRTAFRIHTALVLTEPA